MPCTIAQNWRLSGNQYHNQIMVLSGKAQTSLILLDLFLLIIGTPNFHRSNLGYLEPKK